MSVSFDGYLIDLDRFCSFVGSHDHQIVAAAQNKIAESPYFRRDSEGDREIALAVRNFVDGQFEELRQNLHKRDWMLLAMNGICFTYGECLDNALLNCVHSDLLDELGRGADLLFNRGAPFVMSQADLRGCMG